MNEILLNLINTRKVVSFIDNVIVGMVEEEGHNKIVEEVVKRLAENYKWKVKKVRFLGVVTGPKKIKMEEEEVKEVLN